MKKLNQQPCPNCKKKTLKWQMHPHASGHRTGKVECRSCKKVFLKKTETIILGSSPAEDPGKPSPAQVEHRRKTCRYACILECETCRGGYTPRDGSIEDRLAFVGVDTIGKSVISVATGTSFDQTTKPLTGDDIERVMREVLAKPVQALPTHVLVPVKLGMALEAELVRLRGEVKRLKIVKSYINSASHRDDCYKITGSMGCKCTCGLDAALAECGRWA